MHFARFLAAATAAAVVTVSSAGAGAAVVVHPPVVAAPAFGLTEAAGPDAQAAAQYCRTSGGVSIRRVPEYGTNNPKPLVLAGSADFCQFTAKDGSRIHILNQTLYATLPTLAALAYYAKVKFDSSACPGGDNPASCYCTQLGGSDQFGGATLAGGSWVGRGVDADLQACIFPDLSSIDSFGLFYHSVGTIRGINLAKVLRYHKS